MKVVIYCPPLVNYVGSVHYLISMARVLQGTHEITLLTREYNEHNDELSVVLGGINVIPVCSKLPRLNFRYPVSQFPVFQILKKLRNGLDALISFPKEIDADIFIGAHIYFLSNLAKRRNVTHTIAMIFRPYFHTDVLQLTWMRPLRALMRYLEKQTYKDVDLVLCHCTYIQNVIYSGLSLKPEVLPPPIDVDYFKPNSDTKRDNLILSLSRIDPCKHLLEMTEVFNQLKGDYKFIIAGVIEQGNERYFEELSKIAKRDNRITLIPNPSRTQLPSLYQEATVFWHMNPTEETGTTIQEAAACGTPTVALQGGGLSETIINSKTGFLVESKKEFIDKTIFLLKNKEARDMMGKQAREHIIRRYSYGAFGQRLDELLNSLFED